MPIRKAETADIPFILEIYKKSRLFMRENGNLYQWTQGYPDELSLKSDMEKGSSYIYCDTDRIAASFYFAEENEPSYESIAGRWLNNEPYAVVHRLACGVFGQGIGSECLNYCFSRVPNIRIDTHKDNFPMRALLEKNGFIYCGIIRLQNGSKRMAFQKTAEGAPLKSIP